MKNLLYIILLTLAICLTSCRSIKYVPVETVKTEYKTRDSIRFDSIYEHDSIFLFVKGDTVYKEKYRYKYRYLTINKTDTVMLTDSVQIPYPVEKQLTRWQRMKIELGGWAVGVIVILSIVLMLKLFRN
ncbi:hypothetical protein [Bacteroides sp. AF32-8BH]|jgi:hypothetical protein|uniref:hypothetical protein n=1 Tax=Bacteroides sp. AF32-8BH TaxID=2302925 RepID=UPI000E402E4B|nr:hypothetical protein [Bacteroides sp. AF32-8BH]RGE77062.1 hypothetical protein DWZ47_18680 [Bacteroides sp. AF32-8BH]DAH03670.1 MAG TPA: hypothetical protein [Bacteriophage sp.]